MNVLVSGLLNIETTVAVRSFPINYYPIDYPFFGVKAIPHKDSAADALQIFSSDCIKIPQEY